MKEQYNKDVKLSGLTPNALEEVLNFMYTEKITLSEANVADVLQAASLMLLTGKVLRQFVKPTVHRTDSSSNRQFIEPTVRRTDSSSNRQYVEPTVCRTDSLSNRQFQHFEWTHAMRSSNYIIPIKSVSNTPMQRVYRILLNPITAF